MSTARPVPTRADRRSALVLAAYRQIAARGFEGLRTREVAAEVGVNIATLHYYFPTKEKLIEGVVGHAMQRFQSTLEPHGTSADQLRNYLRAVRRLVQDEPELGAVMGELMLRSSRDPALAGTMQQMYEVWHRTVRGLLKRAAREGHVRPDVDSDEVAAIIVATLTGVSLPSTGGRPDQALRQLERWLGVGPTPRRTGSSN
ncbi:MAG TPA: TetR/AcrR family transcriptional regulator [Candidatus Dormibacteraeota bacterium]|nr:TetR/AcrR family transcriptional regulator [Candidatus Dormibacteraeota bacterium]